MIFTFTISTKFYINVKDMGKEKKFRLHVATLETNNFIA
jgi:hypothetical protein